MKWQVRESATSTGIDEVSVGLRERYAVDDDGVFETPDDLDAGTRRRLDEAGHTPLDDEADAGVADEPDADSGGAVDADGDGDDAAPEEAPAPDDEYSDMDRTELYEEYKDRGGPASWNDTSAAFLRESLRVNDQHGTFPDPPEN